MREDGGDPMWLLGDHLGSTNAVANYDGSLYSRQGYKPWGEMRFVVGQTPTGYQFTGQFNQISLGLYFFNARWYDANLARFVQADSMVPGMGNPQAWDRYTYSYNNPIIYTDPNGHIPVPIIIALFAGVAIGFGTIVHDIWTTPPITDINGSRVESPTNVNMTEWTTNQLKLNLNSKMFDAIQDNLSSNNLANKLAARKLWVAMVKEGAYWDYKGDIRAKFGKNPRINFGSLTNISYEAIANLTYGYIGSAAGFTPIELVIGAGAAQLRTYFKKRNPNAKGPCLSKYACDQPYDNWWILFGIYLFEKYGDDTDNLTTENVEEALIEYIEENDQPPILAKIPEK